MVNASFDTSNTVDDIEIDMDHEPVPNYLPTAPDEPNYALDDETIKFDEDIMDDIGIFY